MKKCVVVGVTGGVAAFKTVQLVSDLVKLGIDVEVIMTENATQFIQPLQFESLTQHSVMIDTFDHRFPRSTQHVSIAKKADCFIVAPATANFIAKAAHGICDDMLTTTFLACNCPKLIAVAMNTQMLENPITQRNIQMCRDFGIEIIESISGYLACGDAGKGKMADIEVLKNKVLDTLETSTLLAGKKVVITAGATQEPMDPVRFITNHSSGKMGIALAKQAKRMGADVTLIHASVSVPLPDVSCVKVTTASEMFEEVKKVYETCDVCIKAAAVSDYRVKEVSDQKIKKNESSMTIELVKNDDILYWCGQHKTHQVLVGFAMETQNLIENATKKCIQKNCDFVVANNLKTEGAGFQGDTNVVTLITKDTQESFDIMSKDDCAQVILEKVGNQLC